MMSRRLLRLLIRDSELWRDGMKMRDFHMRVHMYEKLLQLRMHGYALEITFHGRI